MAPKMSEIEEETSAVVGAFGVKVFSTKNFIDRFSHIYPRRWAEIIEKYGKGGKGAGKRYSSYSYLSQQLQRLHVSGRLNKLHYEPAPAGYGSPVIRYWTTDFSFSSKSDYPDELVPNLFVEGARISVVVNRYERDLAARKACIEEHGLKCSVCDRDFEAMYGAHGAGFIHVHHLKPLYSIAEKYIVDPIQDLRPVCPNCHAMIHRGDKLLTIDEARDIWRRFNGPSN